MKMKKGLLGILAAAAGPAHAGMRIQSGGSAWYI